MTEIERNNFEDLKLMLQNFDEDYDIDMIKKAFEICVAAHEGQKRISGEDYYYHPFNVAKIVISLGMDSESVVASLLHDVVEDTQLTLDDIRRQFGDEVALLVDGVTKIGKLNFSTKEQQQAESLRKMLIAMGKDIRVIIIKLADRLHNMRTIDAMRPQKQRDISVETLEIYAPIAHRLGIRPVKEELEDLAIKHLDPIAYGEIEELLKHRKNHREQILNEIKNRIEERLRETMPNATLSFQGRVKSIHGIYRKMFMAGKNFDEIYDVYAVRIITNTVADCYNILGVMHDLYRPIPGRFKDYISTPKPNGYQSLHTTLLGRNMIPFEVQIRTKKMHQIAEYGVAAHWKYKSGEKSNSEIDDKLDWISKLIDIENEAIDADDFMHAFKIDIFHDETFVFTPKGDVIALPQGATVIDFAYAIHSAVGNSMIGAKINGMIVPIDRAPVTGDIIEILTSSSSKGPSRDWLNIVKTSEARTKIRRCQYFDNITGYRSSVNRNYHSVDLSTNH